MKKRRVVVTGLGTINPLGNSVRESWQNLKDGKSGISKLTKFDPAEFGGGKDFPTIAGEVKSFDLTQLVKLEDLQLVGLSERFIRTTTELVEGIGIGKSEIRKMPLVLQYGVAAVIEALKDAKLNPLQEEAGKRGVVIGSGIGGGKEYECGVEILLKEGLSRIPPRTILNVLINMISGSIALFTGSEGPSEGVVTACATGSHAILRGAEHIKARQVDIVIVGAAEAPLTPFGMGMFEKIHALSHRNDEPEKASRPFDKDRDGFVMSEGTGMLILEELNRAEKRGAKIYGEIVGWGSTTDAFHEVRGNPATQRKCMEIALKMAKLNLKKGGRLYINGHATSTPGGDSTEVEAIKMMFGKDIEKGVLTSKKGQLGHCLGAAATIETIFTLKEMEEGIILPNFNLDKVDPRCQGVNLPTKAMAVETDCFLKNAFAFGGQNACLVIRKFG